MEVDEDILSDNSEHRNNVIHYILNNSTCKYPLKHSEIVAKALNGNGSIFKLIFEEVKKALEETYGILLKTVPDTKSGKQYICISRFPAISSKEFDELQRSQITLLFIVLSYIFMRGVSVSEEFLKEFLKGLHIYFDKPHPFFGSDINKLITETFVKQLYLKKTKSDKDSVEDEMFYSWGYRSEEEFPKKTVLEAVAKNTQYRKMKLKWPLVLLLLFVFSISCVQCRQNAAEGKRNKKQDRHRSEEQEEDDLSLWINEKQLRVLSGFSIKIYAIQNGKVYTDLRDPNFNQYLPTIPSEVNSVNFTWKSGNKKYDYNFDRLKSTDESILKTPTVSIKTKGRIPHHEKDFSIFLPCTGNNSGTAMFSIGLLIQNRKGKPLPGTPLRLRFKKECAHRGVYDRTASNPLTNQQGPDPQCSLKCGNNGFCNHDICQCKAGYMGQYCQTALCYPQCMNGGNCTAPAVCSCPDGYQGRQCEGGICAEKCLNRGKCIQKDTCHCPKGYYGMRCEFSKCVIPCSNNGRCIGNNLCRCPNGTGGNHCEIGRRVRSACKRPCKHGSCQHRKCKCDDGWEGQLCNSRKNKKGRQKSRASS